MISTTHHSTSLPLLLAFVLVDSMVDHVVNLDALLPIQLLRQGTVEHRIRLHITFSSQANMHILIRHLLLFVRFLLTLLFIKDTCIDSVHLGKVLLLHTLKRWFINAACFLAKL